MRFFIVIVPLFFSTCLHAIELPKAFWAMAKHFEETGELYVPPEHHYVYDPESYREFARYRKELWLPEWHEELKKTKEVLRDENGDMVATLEKTEFKAELKTPVTNVEEAMEEMDSLVKEFFGENKDEKVPAIGSEDDVDDDDEEEEEEKEEEEEEDKDKDEDEEEEEDEGEGEEDDDENDDDEEEEKVEVEEKKKEKKKDKKMKKKDNDGGDDY